MELFFKRSTNQEKTLIDVRLERIKRQEEKEKERDIELSSLYINIENNINTMKKLLEKDNSEDIYILAYLQLVIDTLTDAKSFRKDLLKVTDAEYKNAMNYYESINKDLSETIQELERKRVNDSFQYANVSIDEMIGGMALDAENYNRKQTIEKIKGIGEQPSEFERVRKKDNAEDN